MKNAYTVAEKKPVADKFLVAGCSVLCVAPNLALVAPAQKPQVGESEVAHVEGNMPVFILDLTCSVLLQRSCEYLEYHVSI